MTTKHKVEVKMNIQNLQNTRLWLTNMVDVYAIFGGFEIHYVHSKGWLGFI